MVERLQYADLIGTPFEYNGRGPDSYDCWGLVMECYRRQHGVELPDLASPSEPAVQAALGATMMQQNCWRQIRTPHVWPGSIIAIRVGELITHVGYAIDHDKFIHAWKAHGGVAVNPVSAWRRRIEGCYHYAR